MSGADSDQPRQSAPVAHDAADGNVTPKILSMCPHVLPAALESRVLALSDRVTDSDSSTDSPLALNLNRSNLSRTCSRASCLWLSMPLQRVITFCHLVCNA